MKMPEVRPQQHRLRTPLFLSIGLFLTLLTVSSTTAQVPGTDRPSPTPTPTGDSLYIFTPARPLIDSAGIQTELPAALGGSLFFSSSGYGAGLFYERRLSYSTSGFVDLTISGLRGGDELEVYNNDPESIHYQSFFVPNKVNRLWHTPLMIGAKQELFRDLFFDNFRPFVSLGLGGSMVVATPYDHSFFKAFGLADLSFAPGGFLSVGAEVTERRPGIGFSLRYYYLPISPGVESISGEPIDNLGGLFLALSIPF